MSVTSLSRHTHAHAHAHARLKRRAAGVPQTQLKLGTVMEHTARKYAASFNSADRRFKPKKEARLSRRCPRMPSHAPRRGSALRAQRLPRRLH